MSCPDADGASQGPGREAPGRVPSWNSQKTSRGRQSADSGEGRREGPELGEQAPDVQMTQVQRPLRGPGTRKLRGEKHSTREHYLCRGDLASPRRGVGRWGMMAEETPSSLLTWTLRPVKSSTEAVDQGPAGPLGRWASPGVRGVAWRGPRLLRSGLWVWNAECCLKGPGRPWEVREASKGCRPVGAESSLRRDRRAGVWGSPGERQGDGQTQHQAAVSLGGREMLFLEPSWPQTFLSRDATRQPGPAEVEGRRDQGTHPQQSSYLLQRWWGLQKAGGGGPLQVWRCLSSAEGGSLQGTRKRSLMPRGRLLNSLLKKSIEICGACLECHPALQSYVSH